MGRRILATAIIGLLILGAGISGAGQRSPVEGLIDYLKSRYAAPYQPVGQVREIAGEKLLFGKGDHPVRPGDFLWIGAKGQTPGLKPPKAWFQAETVLEQSGVGRILERAKAKVQTGDPVFTPRNPRIYLYSNIAGSPAYGELLKALLAHGFPVREMEESRDLKPQFRPSALRLKLEARENRLAYRLVRAADSQTLFFDTAAPLKTAQTGGPEAATRSEAATGSEPVREPVRSPAAPSPPGDLFRLPGPYHRVVGADLNGDGAQSLVFLGESGLAAYAIAGNQLQAVGRYQWENSELIPLHLHATELDGRPGQELLLSLALPIQTMDKRDSRMASQVLRFDRGEFQPITTDLGFHLRTLTDRQGEPVPLAQARGAYEAYDGPIYRLIWDENSRTVRTGSPYAPARNIHSLYQFTLVPGHPNRILLLEPDASLHGYHTPTEEIKAWGERNYGPFREIAYPVKLETDRFVGGFDRKTFADRYAPRRFRRLFPDSEQSLLIYKERAGIVEGMQRLIAGRQGQDQLVGVCWVGNRIQERWSSQKLGRDLLDFAAYGDPLQIVLLYRDGDGCGIELLPGPSRP